MVRVIKGQKTDSKAFPVKLGSQKTTGPRVIDREIYQAQQEAARILKEGENQKRQRLNAGRQTIAKAKEEAMANAASDAFVQIMESVFQILLKRANQYEAQQSTIVTIAEEAIRKVIGSQLQQAKEQMDPIARAQLHEVRSMRQVDLAFSKGEMETLKNANPQLLKHLENLPELRLIEEESLKPGFLRMVLDIGQVMGPQDPVIQFLKKQFP